MKLVILVNNSILYLKVKLKEIAAQFHTGYKKEESRMTPKYLA